MTRIAGPSLRARLALWHALSLGVVLAVYAAGTALFVRRSLLAELDHQLEDHLEFAAHMLARGPDGGLHWQGTDPAHGGDAQWWMTVRDVDGSARYHLGIPDESGPVRSLAGTRLVDGVPYVVEIAKSENPLRRRMAQLLLGFGLGLPLAILAAAVGGWVLARRALAPLGRMADQARSITAERLSERLPVDPSAGELAELATIFNDTLGRLERSFEQLRRFTADASHELRTPLTAIRSVGEVALQGARDVEVARDAVASMLEEADRMAQLVESLLTLSRADAGHVTLHREPVDLGALAREVTAQLAVLAEERGQTLAVEATAAVEAHVDRIVLRQALVNVVHNAIKHSPDGAVIRVDVAAKPPRAWIEVHDEGPGIAPQHVDKVFDRFYRVDPARARSTGGTGLGLAIARWAVRAHGGEIELDTAPGRGATFRLVVPEGGRPPRTARPSRSA